MSDAADAASSIPIQCVTLDPLCYTPVRLVIADVLGSKPLLGSKSLFAYKTHPVNCVDLMGFVTSLKRKEDSLAIYLDDGTASIQCFCPLQSPRNETLSSVNVSSLSRTLQKRFAGAAKNSTDIALGDFLRVRGQLRQSSWNEVNYVTNCKWKVLDQPDADEMWLKSQREQFDLYREVYDKPFVMDENLRKTSKSFVTKQLRDTLQKSLRPVIEKLVTEVSCSVEFFGYEVLEMEEVKSCLSVTLARSSALIQCLSDCEKSVIASNAVAALLHKHVADGALIKRKCFKHEAVTSMAQLDARYFVASQCETLLNAIRKIVASLTTECRAVNAQSVLKALDLADFNFIRLSKHGEAIIERVLQLICNGNDDDAHGS